ncbi:hypothetical protein OC834_007257 [Tilletia horrida]|nr:hypothetical protein OC834_007257 [Tilletia horrida]
MEPPKEDFHYEPPKKKFKCLPCSKHDLPVYFSRRHIAEHTKTKKHQMLKAKEDARRSRSALAPLLNNAALGERSRSPSPSPPPLGDEFLVPMPLDERAQQAMWEEAERLDDAVLDLMGAEQAEVNRGLDRIIGAAWDGLDAIDDGEPDGWYPCKEKKTLFGVMLWLSPRFAVSKALLDFSFVIARCFNGDPPSIYACERDLRAARDAFPSQPQRYFTASNKPFYTRSIKDLLTIDFATPSTREEMSVYPRRGEVIADVRDGIRMAYNEDTRTTAPMATWGNRQIWTEELLCLEDRTVLRPHNFFEDDLGRMWGEGKVVKENNGRLDVTAAKRTFLLSDVASNEVEVERLRGLRLYDSGKRVPHHNDLRTHAAGKKAFSVPLALFVDDLSGNKSKRWNKHEAIYFSNIALHNEPPLLYDASLNESVVVRPYLLLALCDNPMAAEMCASIGLKGNLFCRICDATAADLGTVDGVKACLEPGEERSATATIQELRGQLDEAVNGIQATIKARKTTTGIKDVICDVHLEKIINIARVSRAAAEREKEEVLERAWHTPLLRLYDTYGFDVSQSTPVEVLHTWLLGPAKYLWVTTCTRTEAIKKRIGVWISSAHTSGIADTQQLDGAYLVANAGSLVGKDIKVITQVAAAVLTPLRDDGTITDELWEAWRWAAVITRLLYAEKINVAHVDAYKEDFRRALANFLWAVASFDSASVVSKRKFHILAHAADSIDAFGPARGFATERYEAFNTITRNASLCSNRTAPSKDIAQRLTDQDMLRQAMLGSRCFKTDTGVYKAAAPAVQRQTEALRDGMLREHYGCKKKGRQHASGTITKRKDDIVLTLANGDRVRKDDSVLLSVPILEGGNQTHLARIEEIRQAQDDAAIPLPALWYRGRAQGSYVQVRALFPAQPRVQDEPDSMLRLRMDDERRNAPIDAVAAAISALHDCSHHDCAVITAPGRRLERQETTAMETKVVHNEDGAQHFILNDGLIRSAALGPLYGHVPQLHTLDEAAEMVVAGAA